MTITNLSDLAIAILAMLFLAALALVFFGRCNLSRQSEKKG